MRFRLLLGLVLALAGCGDEERAPEELPYGDAERVRELTFLERPRVERRSRDEFLKTSGRAMLGTFDRSVDELRGVFGRLGYFPPSFDLRAAVSSSNDWVGAFYSPEDKALTLFEDPEPEAAVHELVHALQDQHFDLIAFDADAKTTDERLARHAVAEGDATICQLRFMAESAKVDPLDAIARNINSVEAGRQSDELLNHEGKPAWFLATPGFVYPFGSAFMARQVIGSGGWVSARDDALFTTQIPLTTEAILREGLGVDPVVEVGLAALPQELAGRYDVRDVDRLGAWYAYLLVKDRVDRELAKSWDGDQLVTLSTATIALDSPTVAVVWTSIWETAFAAQTYADALRGLHGIGDTANDGEPCVIVQKDLRIALAKGAVDRTDLVALAEAALR